ncbi:MAG: glycosyltransferase [Candidatus Magasanikbacteria bacterium]|nr:glycosyltransferase [Candidatus Magasanikbacteria bacterium]
MKINLTIPIYNEELVLAENVQKILNFITQGIELQSHQWQIILADNKSTDKTTKIAQSLEKKHPKKINYLRIDKKGKGRAIRAGWQKFPADYYIFMDADLSTDLSTLPHLIEELENNADVVIGSRYLPKSVIQRSFGRKIISKIYHWLGQQILNLPFSDLPCGFKGVNQKIIDNVLPRIKNQEWFFDTELLYRAQKEKYKIKEMPVKWTETLNQKRKSRVGLLRVSAKYLTELLKIKMASD